MVKNISKRFTLWDIKLYFYWVYPLEVKVVFLDFSVNSDPLKYKFALSVITLYVKRIRLDFTNETPEEIEQIVIKFKQKLEDMHTNKFFDSQTETTGYFKRPIQ